MSMHPRIETIDTFLVDLPTTHGFWGALLEGLN
jgi:hypothetical protein